MKSPRDIEPIAVTWNGIIYPSLNAAARALGLPLTTVTRRHKKGYTQDSDLLRSKHSPVRNKNKPGFIPKRTKADPIDDWTLD